MGYYAHTTDVSFRIKKENLDAAYQAAIELNNHNELKTGGSYGGGVPDPIPEGPNPYRRFGWVDWDYHLKCKDLSEVLGMFGFESFFDDEGDIVNLHYPDDKISGGEEELLKCLAPYVESNSYVCWRGEDDGIWRLDFIDGEAFERGGQLVEQWEE
jgi:hypothetical protein